MINKIKAVLVLYGKEVLKSEEFANAFKQTHHACSTVADHSLGVAVIAIAISMFLIHIHVKIELRYVVIAALCHDLGIIGRYEKYKNNIECCKRHPVDSVDVYRKIFGESNERIEDSIRNHMWPLTPVPPRYIEGVILTIADKVSATMEKIGVAPMRKLELAPIRFA
ncbi:MAG: HD domain-containing protein [Butyrivibrio sp.]|nr:HD domain-containing protein [Butyrivibrio sp.]